MSDLLSDFIKQVFESEWTDLVTLARQRKTYAGIVFAILSGILIYAGFPVPLTALTNLAVARIDDWLMPVLIAVLFIWLLWLTRRMRAADRSLREIMADSQALETARNKLEGKIDEAGQTVEKLSLDMESKFQAATLQAQTVNDTTQKHLAKLEGQQRDAEERTTALQRQLNSAQQAHLQLEETVMHTGSDTDALEARLIEVETAVRTLVSSAIREFSDNFEHGLINWEYYGDWRTEKDGDNYILVVTNSDSGGFARPCRLWNDYEFNFDTKIVAANTTWIIRASSIAQYVMLQCGRNEIIPHYRLSNQFFRLDPVSLPTTLPLNEWFTVRLRVSGIRVLATATLNGRAFTLLDRNLLEPVTAQATVTRGETSQVIQFVPDFPSGSVGFREWGNTECAHFRNVRVTKI